MSEERLPTEEFIALLADVAREKGINVVQVGTIRLEMGPKPAPPEEPLTDEQRKARATAAATEAVRARLRKSLGRNPTDEEIAAFGDLR